MGFYRKRPVVIQAIEWTGDNFVEMCEFAGCISEDYLNPTSSCRFYTDPSSKVITIKTLEGDMRAIKGDYILKGVKGELYPCRRDIFLETYETVI